MRIQMTLLPIALLATSYAFAAGAPTAIEGTDYATGETKIVRLAEAAKGTLVVFLSARCPCSASHEVALKKLHEEYSPKGFRFVGVHSNSDETPELGKQHFDGTKLPFPVLRDQGLRAADAFAALKTPHAFLVSPDGKTLFQGGVDDSKVHAKASRHFVREALAAIDEGRTPPVEQARALGCIIKR